MMGDTDGIECARCGGECDSTDAWTDGFVALCGSMMGIGCDAHAWTVWADGELATAGVTLREPDMAYGPNEHAMMMAEWQTEDGRQVNVDLFPHDDIGLTFMVTVEGVQLAEIHHWRPNARGDGLEWQVPGLGQHVKDELARLGVWR